MCSSVQQNLSNALSGKPETVNSRSNVTSPKSDKAVWYFAYGSNLSPKVFGPRSSNIWRRFQYLEATKARLPGFRLVFNVRGIPLLEPCFANIREDPDGIVTGVLYKLSYSDWKRLTRSEGVDITGVYKERSVRVLKEDSGETLMAFTLVAEDSRFTFAEEVMPSSRYLRLVLDGMQHWKLNSVHRFLGLKQEKDIASHSVSSRPAFAVVNTLAGFLPADLVSFSSVAHWETGALRFLKVPSQPLEESCVENSQTFISEYSSSAKSQVKPVLLYLPGIDGTGLGILPQLDALRKHFDVHCLVWPSSKLYNWQQLVDKTLVLIEDIISKERSQGWSLEDSSKVWLVAESMGCCLALLLAEKRPELFEHITLVNPATSYSRSFFSSILSKLDTLPPLVYQVAPVAISPLLLDFGRRLSQPDKLLHAARSLPKLSEILPPETLGHRIRLIEKFSANVKEWRRLKTKVLIIASVNDLLIPSYAESERLLDIFPKSVRYISHYGGHGLLLERDIGLSQLILRSHEILSSSESSNTKYQNIYPGEKTLPVANVSHLGSTEESHDEDFKFPSLEDIHRAKQQLLLYNKIFSPVFIGTNRVPEQRGRPILFVGNHTLYGITDVPFFIEHFLSKRNILIRALAHPIFWNWQSRDRSSRLSRSLWDDSSRFLEVMERFGSVPATPRNLYRLLEKKQSVLLFPGGAREAFKRKDEAYSLHWPREAEFVRMAIRHDAWIVPFSCVGPEDNFQIILDGEELIQLPLVGRLMESLFSLSDMPKGDVVREWKGPLNKQDLVNFIQPLSIPRSPHRIYFYFSSPIDSRLYTSAMKNRSQVEEMYGNIRDQVENGIRYLLDKRKEDPFEVWWKRIVFESVTGVAAPTKWQWSLRDGYLDRL
ncbi:Acyltransferase-like protein At1g54570, chloroplastic [Galdieria sulphuraria]|nr:Acyltransferase-like protein At1g54570, chloroplastic [Galdieria sulphuraria]